jgi:hypothetical protein
VSAAAATPGSPIKRSIDRVVECETASAFVRRVYIYYLVPVKNCGARTRPTHDLHRAALSQSIYIINYYIDGGGGYPRGTTRPKTIIVVCTIQKRCCEVVEEDGGGQKRVPTYTAPVKRVYIIKSIRDIIIDFFFKRIRSHSSFDVTVYFI